MTTRNWADASIAVIGNGRSFTFLIDGEVFTISDTQPNFKQALKAREDKNLDELLMALKPLTIVERAASSLGTIRLDGDRVFAGDRELRGVIIDRILEFKRDGIDFKYLLNFLDRLQANPSKTAIDELYLFLESSATPLPITEDGFFLAYKKVKSNFKDIHSGKVDYTIGKVVEMPRNQVDDVRDRTCSYGLHFCSLDYLKSFGGSSDPIVIVKIDPGDVVSIPSDYKNTKGRTCKMEVVALHKGTQTQTAFSSNFVSAKTFTGSTVRDGWSDKVVESPKKTTQYSTPKPAPSSARYTYWPTREAARAEANATGKQFKDFGWGSNTGYRWATKN